MINFRLFLLLFYVLTAVLPLYAYEIDQDLKPDPPVLSALTEEQIKKSPRIVEDFSSNENAVGAVKRNITLFSEKIRERFSVWLSRSGKYLEMMKEILKEKNVPEEIVFLPLIESGFNPYAYSTARAAGYWQFIASTAKRYGLEINWWKDERRDPVKSTVAAANYLTDLYEMFGSWNLAMAAYNAGEGRILRALNKTNTDDYWSLIRTNQLKSETRDYVPKFIAASLIANSPQNFGFEDLEYHPPLNYDKVTIKSPLDLEVIAACAETTEEIIKELNSELRRWCTPPDVTEYVLRVPEGKKDIFIENLSKIPEENRFTVDIYKVKKGDTFKAISKKTGVPVQVVLDLNSLEKIIPLKAGAEIYLPPKGKFVLDRDDRKGIKKASFKQKKKTLTKDRNSQTGKAVKKVTFKPGKKELKNKSRKV
ncbi:MAG: transglycosylase SLT domain-containing protein [Nitrospirota bacterium]|nr:transglycosylase SLT domain-containing protein [Nitrospirota bacterium]